MANEVRRRTNNVQGTLSSTMNSTQTSMNSAGLANLEAISSTEHAAICIDPGRTAGAPEIVWVTAHTGSATSATVSRGKEGTSARAHSSTEEWVHAPTAATDFLPYRPPSARVRRDAAQSVTNNTWTAITFDVEDWDTDTIWSSTAANKLKVKTAGKYMVNFTAEMGSSAGSERGVGIFVNTTVLSVAADGYLSDIKSTAIGAGQILSVSGPLALTTSDTVSGLMFQNSGSGVNTTTSLLLQPKMSIIWVSS